MNQNLLQPLIDDSDTSHGRWMVVMFNNDVTPYDDVIRILMQATRCDLREAAIETWEAHTFGKAMVHFAARPECVAAAEVISTIGVKTAVCLEWDEA